MLTSGPLQSRTRQCVHYRPACIRVNVRSGRIVRGPQLLVVAAFRHQTGGGTSTSFLHRIDNAIENASSAVEDGLARLRVAAWRGVELRLLLQVGQVAASLAFVALYIWSTYEPACRGSWRHSADLALSAVFAADLAARIKSAGSSWLRMLLTPLSLLDVLSFAPGVLELCGATWPVTGLAGLRLDLRWFRIFRALRLLRLCLLTGNLPLMKLSRSALLSGAVNVRLMQLVASVLALLFTSASLVHAVERLPWHDALYFVTTTLTTVGYGDVVVRTMAGRLIVLVFMAVGVVLIPVRTSQLWAQLASRRLTAGTLDPGRPVVLLSTRLTEVRGFADLTDEFFHQVHQQRFVPHDVHLMVLGNKPSHEFMAFQELNDQRITLVEGSVLSAVDLIRCRAAAAAAVLVLGDRFAHDAASEDLDVLFRVWAIKSYTKCVPLTVQVLRASSLAKVTPFLDPHQDVVMSVEQMRHRLLALSALCPGASTLLGNLLHTAQPSRALEDSVFRPRGAPPPKLAGRSWFAEYVRGCGHDLHLVAVAAEGGPPPAYPSGAGRTSCRDDGSDDGGSSNSSSSSSRSWNSFSSSISNDSSSSGHAGGGSSSQGAGGLVGCSFGAVVSAAFQQRHLLVIGVLSNDAFGRLALNPPHCRPLLPSDQLLVIAQSDKHAESVRGADVVQVAAAATRRAAEAAEAAPLAAAAAAAAAAREAAAAFGGGAADSGCSTDISADESCSDVGLQQLRLRQVAAAAATAATAAAAAAGVAPLQSDPYGRAGVGAPAASRVVGLAPCNGGGGSSGGAAGGGGGGSGGAHRVKRYLPSLASWDEEPDFYPEREGTFFAGRYDDDQGGFGGGGGDSSNGYGSWSDGGQWRQNCAADGSVRQENWFVGEDERSSTGYGLRERGHGDAAAEPEPEPWRLAAQPAAAASSAGAIGLRSGSFFGGSRSYRGSTTATGAGGGGSSNGYGSGGGMPGDDASVTTAIPGGSSNGSNYSAHLDGGSSSYPGSGANGSSRPAVAAINGGAVASNVASSLDEPVVPTEADIGAVPHPVVSTPGAARVAAAAAVSRTQLSGSGGGSSNQTNGAIASSSRSSNPSHAYVSTAAVGAVRAVGHNAPSPMGRPYALADAPWRQPEGACSERRGHIILAGAIDSFVEFARVLHSCAGMRDPDSGLSSLEVVVLHPNPPESTVLALGALGPTRLVRGSPDDPQALQQAGAAQARCLVYLGHSERPAGPSSGSPSDSPGAASPSDYGSTSQAAVQADAEALLTCYGVGEEAARTVSEESTDECSVTADDWEQMPPLAPSPPPPPPTSFSRAQSQQEGSQQSGTQPSRLPPPADPTDLSEVAASYGYGNGYGFGAYGGGGAGGGGGGGGGGCFAGAVRGHSVVELSFTSSVRFLQPGLLLQGTSVWDESCSLHRRMDAQPRRSWRQRREAEEAAAQQGLVQWQTNIYYGAGRVVVPALVDTFTIQAFAKRNLLLDVMSELCGDDGRPSGTPLRLLPVPRDLAGRPYRELFDRMVTHGSVPLGLYRSKSENPAWRLHYVSTNPAWEDLVSADDKVFVLWPAE